MIMWEIVVNEKNVDVYVDDKKDIIAYNEEYEDTHTTTNTQPTITK